MSTLLTVDHLRQAAAKLPRVSLAHLPTPLEEVQRFAARLNGPRVFIKRDDCNYLPRLCGIRNGISHNHPNPGQHTDLKLRERFSVVTFGVRRER